jgi:hypothetical protein
MKSKFRHLRHKLLLLTNPKSSVSSYLYQKDTRALPGYLRTRCSFSSVPLDIKCFSLLPKMFSLLFLFYYPPWLLLFLFISSPSKSSWHCCLLNNTMHHVEHILHTCTLNHIWNFVAQVFRNEGPWPVRDTLKLMQHYRSVLRKDTFEGVGGLLVE